MYESSSISSKSSSTSTTKTHVGIEDVLYQINVKIVVSNADVPIPTPSTFGIFSF